MTGGPLNDRRPSRPLATSARRVGDRVVLTAREATYELNQTAAYLYRLCDGKTTEEVLVDRLAQHIGGARQDLVEVVDRWLGDMLALGSLELESSDDLLMNSGPVVLKEYAKEDRLVVRKSIYEQGRLAGRDAKDVLLETIITLEPSHVLEVGCGTGDFAQRLSALPGVQVTAVDQSARMVELTNAHGISACVADAAALPFADLSFDAVVSSWMLYHVPNILRAVSEFARVLSDEGVLLATTKSADHLCELWEFVGQPGNRNLPFRTENGFQILSSAFSSVEEIRVEGTVTFPTPNSVQNYVEAAMISTGSGDHILPWKGAIVARRIVSIFVCRQPRRSP